MASTVDQGTDSLWRSYAKQITEKLAGGGSLGKRNAVFVCPLTTQGIAAGEHIFPEVTNNQLYRAVDSLLNPTSPVYVPGEGSYFNTISTYLKHVILVCTMCIFLERILTKSRTKTLPTRPSFASLGPTGRTKSPRWRMMPNTTRR